MNGLLKFITCGSVDDGKSTLIGHMLYDAKLLYADQERALELDSKVGSREGAIDYSLLLDGLMAEREQGITIDVAYRYFTTDKRSFIVADTPGHEEYTRNMAVGASFADLAVILVDATQGILSQTRRHAQICGLMGIKHFVFAINKMDLIKYDSKVYNDICERIGDITANINISSMQIIPVSATEGDNITTYSNNMPWYEGDTLLSYLENISLEEKDEIGFVFPVQRVSRPNHSFRGFQGRVECGEISVGNQIKVLPSGETATVTNLLNTDKTVNTIYKGNSATIQLNREIDISRGCVITSGTDITVADSMRCTILWMDDLDLIEGKSFIMKIGTKTVAATISNIKYKININTNEHIAAKHISKNEIASCEIIAQEKIAFDKFQAHKGIGHFILIDRISNMTSACGIVEHELRRSDNVFWQELDITRQFRASRLNQEPKTIWFTGLSGAGKSTLANELEKRLQAYGKYTMILDGDNVRLGLNKNLGFKDEDRIENIRRVAEVSKLMNDAGLLVITSFISPYEADRNRAREIIGTDNYIEVYVATSLEECIRRDTKGLYKKSMDGLIPNFTGINSPYEKPSNPDITIDTANVSIDEATEILFNELLKYIK